MSGIEEPNQIIFTYLIYNKIFYNDSKDIIEKIWYTADAKKCGDRSDQQRLTKY